MAKPPGTVPGGYNHSVRRKENEMTQIEMDAMSALIRGMREMEEIPKLLDRIARNLEDQNRLLEKLIKD